VTLRTRVTLAAGVAVLVAAVAVSATVYLVVRDSLHEQVDNSLRHQGPVSRHNLTEDSRPVSADLPLAHEVFGQVVDRDGELVARIGQQPMPVTDEVLAVARGERADIFFTVDVDGTPVRAYATSAGDGTALQVGRSLAEVEQALSRLVWTLVLISVVTVGLAAVLGRLVAAAAAAPVHRVAEAADAVAKTGELSHHIPVAGGDDLARLAASFNTMLDALSQSLARQRQLVADASHELRTPLATVRTNVEVLARADQLAPDDRAMLIGDTVAQVAELTRLVGDLVELARGDGQEEPFTVVDLYELTSAVVGDARQHHPAVEFSVDGTRTVIRAAPGRVSRAVANLVDNAAKWSPPGAAVEVVVHDGAVSVRDHGPGVDPADLPHIFDRFYRAPRTRTMPGSGLGLAIVKQVADSHGATITAAAAPGGGALFTLRVPPVTGDRGAQPELPNRFSPSL
jgi:two-component system sensor histidine kinase MprB